MQGKCRLSAFDDMVCLLTFFHQCRRADEMKKQINLLWQNNIPMCIEVLLFPECRHGQMKAMAIELLPPDHGDGYVLLEQWTIQNLTRK